MTLAMAGRRRSDSGSGTLADALVRVTRGGGIPVAGFGTVAARLERRTYADSRARRSRATSASWSAPRPGSVRSDCSGCGRRRRPAWCCSPRPPPGPCWAGGRWPGGGDQSPTSWPPVTWPAARLQVRNLVGRDTAELGPERDRPGHRRVGGREHLGRRGRSAALGRGRRHPRAARLPRGEHPGRDGRAPLAALRAVRLGGGPAGRPGQLGAGPGGRAGRRGGRAAGRWLADGGAAGRRGATRASTRVPNAGVVEAAFAGALGIRLGGRNVYRGQVEERGVLGDGPRGRRSATSRGPTGWPAIGPARSGRRWPWRADPQAAGDDDPDPGRHRRGPGAGGGAGSRRQDVLTSLAGRVRDPALPPGRVRVGGFGGVDGLAAFLRSDGVTRGGRRHPPVRRPDQRATPRPRRARTGVPLLRLERPGWADHPQAGALDLGRRRRRRPGLPREAYRHPFLTTGRQSLAAFLPWADRSVLARVVDPPELAVPERWTLITARGPYALRRRTPADGRGTAVDVLLTKDSGGAHTAAKLDAAGDLGIPVVIIARPRRRAGCRYGQPPSRRRWPGPRCSAAGRTRLGAPLAP